MGNNPNLNRNCEGVVSAFLARQKEVLELLAAPAIPGESIKSVFARIAWRGGISRSKAEKAYRGYTVLRGDEWDRVNEAAKTASGAQSDTIVLDRATFEQLKSSLADLHRKIDALNSRASLAGSYSGSEGG